MNETLIMAMDRATVRTRDANGFLHVEVSNISKANVCPYRGAEIPRYRELGLDPDRIYHLYRDPAELAKASATFNNVPLLSEHMPVIPDELPGELIIGSTGTDAEFDGTYLRNSLVVWDAASQNAIETDRKRELSCGYRYTADMTPGVTEDGLRFDGVMRDIQGNHVALVIEGRAGPDVLVGDELMKLKSRTALMVSGAVQGFVRPLLAADAKVDIALALDGVSGPTLTKKGEPKKIAGKIAKLVTPHLAADAAIDADALAGLIGAIIPLAADEDMIDGADEDEESEKDEPKGEDEDEESEKDEPKGEDEDDDEEKEKQGMDAATVRRMIAAAERRGAKRVAALDTARADVKPLVGEVIGMDSAEAIYGFALRKRGYDKQALDGAPLETLRGMVKREIEIAKPASRALAQDSAARKAASDSFETLYGSAK